MLIRPAHRGGFDARRPGGSRKYDDAQLVGTRIPRACEMKDEAGAVAWPGFGRRGAQRVWGRKLAAYYGYLAAKPCTILCI